MIEEIVLQTKLVNDRLKEIKDRESNGEVVNEEWGIWNSEWTRLGELVAANGGIIKVQKAIRTIKIKKINTK